MIQGFDRTDDDPMLPLVNAEATKSSRKSYLSTLLSGRPLSSRRYRTLSNLGLALFLCCVLAYWHADDAVSVHFRDFGYISRPLWDKPPKRFSRVIRLAGEDDPLWANAKGQYADVCKAHGLSSLPAQITVPKVYDAMIFSVELDLLEIRMRELLNVVDKFIVVESNVTFSGAPRPYRYPANAEQFAFAKDKIIYGQVGNLHLSSATKLREDPFENERRMRQGVSDIIDKLAKPPVDSIILQSDVDEIPSARAINLLKHCTGWGNAIHLGMPSYLYSFEFPMQRETVDSIHVNNGEGYGPRQSRAAAKVYRPGIYNGFTHSRSSDSILELAGWHVTFGFRYIEDFVFKMRSYSHNDRVTQPEQLLPQNIQEKICAGKDVFEMLPEAYDFKSLYSQLGAIPRTASLSGLPAAVLADKKRFGYLLPGGCRRELAPSQLDV